MYRREVSYMVNEIIGFNNLEKAADEHPEMLLEFFATWCPHCQRMQPILESLSNQLAGQVYFAQVDVDKNQDLAERFNVESTPTFFFIKNKEANLETTGELSEENLLDFIRQGEER